MSRRSPLIPGLLALIGALSLASLMIGPAPISAGMALKALVSDQGAASIVVREIRLPRTCLALDYFDASIDRIAARAIGMRNARKALLAAYLAPGAIRAAEYAGDWTARLALQEERKTLPLGAVWDYYCLKCGVPAGTAWLEPVRRYERQVLSNR